MATSSSNQRCVHFGVFEVDFDAAELRKRGRKVKLQDQPFQALALLLERPGEVVTRKELQQALWSSNTFVEFDHGLNTALKKIRQALGDSPTNPRFIETIPRHGYRFIAAVDTGETPAPVRRRLSPAWIVAVLALAGLAGTLAWLLVRTTETEEAPLTAVPLTSYPGTEYQPTLSPDGSQVAFGWTGEEGDNLDIYVKVVGRERRVRLTSDPRWDVSPAWSPDGASIAFLRLLGEARSAVLLTTPLGGPEHVLTEVNCRASPGFGPYLAWSPDSKWLVVADKDSHAEPLALFLLSIETGEKRRLTNPPGGSLGDKCPAFSPDGRSLVFDRQHALYTGDLYLLPLGKGFSRKGEPRQLTFENLPVFGATWTDDGGEIIVALGRKQNTHFWRIAASGAGRPRRLGFEGKFPSISREGQRLVFEKGAFSVSLWRAPLSQAGDRAGTPVEVAASSRIDDQPDFSPGGERIAFVSNRSGRPEVWVYDSDSGDTEQVTSLGDAHGPRWSPDGRRIAFTSRYYEEQPDIFVIRWRAGAPRRLTIDRGEDVTPSWSRDGRWIYFSSNRSGEAQVWKMPADGGDAVQITRNGGWAPSESPDGKFLYYLKADASNDTYTSSLWKVPTEGGEETQVVESISATNYAVVKQGVYFIPGQESESWSTEADSSIQFLDFRTGNTRQIAALEHAPMWGFSVSADGKSILYSLWDEFRSDLMLVENFR